MLIGGGFFTCSSRLEYCTWHHWSRNPSWSHVFTLWHLWLCSSVVYVISDRSHSVRRCKWFLFFSCFTAFLCPPRFCMRPHPFYHVQQPSHCHHSRDIGSSLCRWRAALHFFPSFNRRSATRQRVLSSMSSCISKSKLWAADNKLKFNDCKTDALLITSSFLKTKPTPSALAIGDQSWPSHQNIWCCPQSWTRHGHSPHDGPSHQAVVQESLLPPNPHFSHHLLIQQNQSHENQISARKLQRQNFKYVDDWI